MGNATTYFHPRECAWHPSLCFSDAHASLDVREHVFPWDSKEEIERYSYSSHAAKQIAGVFGWTEEANGTYFVVYPQECDVVRPQLGQYNIVQMDEYMFVQLVEEWREERGVTSSASEMILCPSYLAIIGMGKKALPLILSQMEREGDDPDHWFVALKAITGEDPVSEDAYGDTVRMAQAWFSLARSKYDW